MRKAKRIYSYLHSESDARSKLGNLSLISSPSGIERLQTQFMLPAQKPSEYVGLFRVLFITDPHETEKKAMHFKILSFPNQILDTRMYATTSPTHTGNRHSCKPTAWNDRSLFLYCSEFPFKAKKVCIKFGLPALQRTGKFNPSYYTRGLAERPLRLNRDI